MTTDLQEHQGRTAVAAMAAARRAGAAPDRAANDSVSIIGAVDTVGEVQSRRSCAGCVLTMAAPDDVHHRIGALTRVLHDALRELGYDKDLAATREHLPDARDRLSYIARVTGEAAEKVLNAVDHARNVQAELTQQAGSLRLRWSAVGVYAEAASAGDAVAQTRATPAGRKLVEETCNFFAALDGQADRTQAILTDIMMAQDFHDLTGQVIRKVVALAQNMEEQLVRLLIETTPPEQRRKVDAEKLSGPIVNAQGRDDVVSDQRQVDDLLASLGF